MFDNIPVQDNHYITSVLENARVNLNNCLLNVNEAELTVSQTNDTTINTASDIVFYNRQQEANLELTTESLLDYIRKFESYKPIIYSEPMISYENRFVSNDLIFEYPRDNGSQYIVSFDVVNEPDKVEEGLYNTENYNLDEFLNEFIQKEVVV